jgi:hypothetical protein
MLKYLSVSINKYYFSLNVIYNHNMNKSLIKYIDVYVWANRIFDMFYYNILVHSMDMLSRFFDYLLEMLVE